MDENLNKNQDNNVSPFEGAPKSEMPKREPLPLYGENSIAYGSVSENEKESKVEVANEIKEEIENEPETYVYKPVESGDSKPAEDSTVQKEAVKPVDQSGKQTYSANQNGQPQREYAQPYNQYARPNIPLELMKRVNSAFGKGLASLIICWLPIGSIVAIFLSAFAIKNAGQNDRMAISLGTVPGGKNTAARVMGIIGLVLSIIYTVMYIILAIVFIVALVMALNGDLPYHYYYHYYGSF